MRIGVTGSSGLIGTALIDALRERGDDVVRFVRPGASTGDSALAVRWDPATHDLDDGDLRKVGGLDAVVHLAGAGIADQRWSKTRRAEIANSRAQSTSLLVSAISALPSGCAFVASGSAIGYYGSRGDEILDESSSPGDDFLAGVCVQWEASAEPLRAIGTNVAYLRTGIVMSTRGGALAKQLPLFRLGLGGRLSSGRQWLSPISLDDEVRAILWLIEGRHDGPFNLTAPNPLTNADFTRTLARSLHRPAMAAVPSFALELALGRDLACDAVLASQRVLPQRLSELGFTFRHVDAAAILTWALQQRR